MRRLTLLLVATLLIAGCTTLVSQHYDSRFGPADPNRFDHPQFSTGDISYRRDIQPILNNRCVVCHACYDAPCQLKLGSWEGVTRGASKAVVYDASRLLSAEPTRLFVDAEQPSEWRNKGFFPVLNEQQQSPASNLAASTLFRLLKLKERAPEIHRNSFDHLDFSLSREQTCAAGEQMDRYETKIPEGGMPFGLPPIKPLELQTLARWLEQGAPFDGRAPLPDNIQRLVQDWENLFNGESNKSRLFARYAYEHLFLAHLFFDEISATGPYFQLVRSRTPPGQPIQIIATSRPVDDPKVEHFYYRLQEHQETVVDKTYMPYALNAARMARWRSLFLDAPYEVEELPGYGENNLANPFRTFADLPINARYRFMIDEAEFTVMGFIKGPVCRGQTALNVIDDRFWVLFSHPSDASATALGNFLSKEEDLLRLPTGSVNTGILKPWLEFGKLERKYLAAKSAELLRQIESPAKLNLDMIWDGDGKNPNAALTIFRNFDNATVIKGLVGEPPKTAWVITYPLLERIHYLLVANYDVFGSLGLQLNSRIYMDYLRMEGEFNFLVLLPEAYRKTVRDYWYRRVSESTRDMVYGDPAVLPIETGIAYKTQNPRQELLDLLRKRMQTVLNTSYDLSRVSDPSLRRSLQTLTNVAGEALEWIPELSVIAVESPAEPTRYFTLLVNRGHYNISHLLTEKKELLPAENTLSVVPGIIGSYPNAFYRMHSKEINGFSNALSALKSEKDYTAFADRYAMRRTDAKFWEFSDALHESLARSNAPGAAILDYNRLENR